MTTLPTTIVLDNQAVQTLADVRHRKHQRALAFIEVANQRNSHRRQEVGVLVPVAVRVEAGWDRSPRDAALLNRISRAQDSVLDGRVAN